MNSGSAIATRATGLSFKRPSLLKPEARAYADLPGGHSEGYDDTFKQMFRRFLRIDQRTRHPSRVSAVHRRAAATNHPQS